MKTKRNQRLRTGRTLVWGLLGAGALACEPAAESADAGGRGGSVADVGAGGSAGGAGGSGGGVTGGSTGGDTGGSTGGDTGGSTGGDTGGTTGGSTGGSAGGTGGTGGSGGAVVPFTHLLELVTDGNDVPAGSTYFVPLNAPGQKTPLFSDLRQTFTLINRGDAAITLQAIRATHRAGQPDDEFRILDHRDLANPPLDAAGITVAPGENFEFIVEFYPMVGDRREADIEIDYGAAEPFGVTVAGEGRPDGTRLYQFDRQQWQLSLGGDITREMITGMALDAAQNVYLTGHVTQIRDRFSTDLFIAKFSPDGTLLWNKLWSGAFRDRQPDPGQNGESGGSADALRIGPDGYLYLVGSHSDGQQNNPQTSHALALKIDPADGAVVWQKTWGPNAEAYALDVTANRVTVVGTMQSDNEMFVLSLAPADGGFVWVKKLDPVPGSQDRAYTVRVRDGKAWIGGLTNGRGFVGRVDDVETAAPTVGFAARLDMGVGSNVNTLDVDAEGNVYLGCDRRGAQTYVSAMRLSPAGQVQWAKTYNEADNNDSNNTHVVRLNGDQVLIGGRVHEEEFDGQMGDALLLRLDRASGAYVDSAFYFGGKGAEELTEHRLKGLGAAPDGTLYLVGQAYTANLNFTQYWGHWYAGRAELTDFIVGAVAGNGGLGYQMSDLPGLALAAPQGNQQFRDAAQVMGSQTGQPTLQAYIDVPMAEPLEDRTGIMSVGPLKANRDDCDGRQGADCFENGAADADVFVMKIGEAGAAPPPPPPPPAGCAEDADCAAGQVCNVRTGECEAAPPPPPPPGACPAGTLLLDAAVDGVSNGGMLQVTGSVPAAGLTQGTCGGAGAELVVRFTAAADGMYTFTTDGSPADTVLYLREACADAAAELGCNDDVGGGPLTSLVTVALTAGQTVFAYVDHFAPDVDPAVTLNIIAP